MGSIPTPVVAAFLRTDGSIAILFEGGTVRVVSDGRIAEEIRTIPPGAYVVPLGEFHDVDGNLLVPYQSPPDSTPAGAALIDFNDLAVRWRFSDTDDVEGVADSSVSRILTGGTVVAVSATSGPRGLFTGLGPDSTLVLIR